MARLNIDQYFTQLALLTARRSTCLRRSVGCVLVSQSNHVIATGYNGVPSGQPHCNEGFPCAGWQEDSGYGLELCDAVHAEENALLQLGRAREWMIHTVYTTTSPCLMCMKLLCKTGAKKLVFIEEYEHWNAGARMMWESNEARTWHQETVH